MSNKKLNLSDLLARKESRKNDRPEYKVVNVPELGGGLEIRRLPLLKFLDMMDGINEYSSPAESMQKQIDIIYESVPLFHNSELQEAYECAEPTDIVTKVLNENMGALTEILTAIFSFYGMDADGSALAQLKD